MIQLEISLVQSSADRRDFLSFPYEIYKRDPYWVAPLRLDQEMLFDPAKHPFYLHGTIQCFLARCAGETVGRIAAILDPNYSVFHGEKASFFGFLEMIEDQAVVTGLLTAARSWLHAQGAEVIRGPVNPSTNYECGVLVDGFDSSPRIMMTYNPPYYGPLIEAAGLRKAKDLVAYDLPVAKARADRVQALTDKAASNGVHLRTLRLEDYDNEVELAWGVYNSAWEKNWGFVPMTPAEFRHHGHELKQILIPELAWFAEVDGQAIGFALAIPDINEALHHLRGRLLPFGLFKLLWYKRKIQYLRVIVLGVKHEFRPTPAAAALYAALIRECARLKFRGAECSWILEDNVLMRRSIEALGGTVYKTYRIYEF
jgi:hypothetical protein